MTSKSWGVTYHVFPTSFGSWNYQYYDEMHIPTGNFTSYLMLGDTIISSTIYKKIFIGSYAGALRESNKIVYFIPDTSSTEYILYNFNLNQGDTLFHPFGPCCCAPIQDTMIVNFVDSIISPNGYLRQIHFNFVTWIEGVGSIFHLLQPFAVAPVSGNDFLECMVGDNGIVYAWNSSYCITSTHDESNQTVISHFYPNPFQTLAVLKLEDPRYSNGIVNIYNEYGQLVNQFQMKNLEAIINKNNLTCGIYFYQVKKNGLQIISGKFIID